MKWWGGPLVRAGRLVPLPGQRDQHLKRRGRPRPAGYYFKGTIDEVRIYNRALSQAEIQADMATPIN